MNPSTSRQTSTKAPSAATIRGASYVLTGVLPASGFTPERATFTTRVLPLMAAVLVQALVVLVAIATAPATSAQTPAANWSFGSGQATGGAGDGIAFVGDVNGDGYDDVIVGAPSFDVVGPVSTHTNAGKVWLFYGSATGLSQTPAWSFDGPTNNTNTAAGMGSIGSIAAAGDINGDGFGDVLIGCEGYDIGSTSTNEGCVFVFFGSLTGLPAAPNQTLIGPAGSRFGASVAGRGRVNNDNFADIAVAGYSYNPGSITSAGGVWVFTGGPAGLNTTPFWHAAGDQASSQFGRGLALADVNGDGYTEVIAGGQLYDPPGGSSNAGGVFLWSAGPTGINSGIQGTFANAAWTCFGNATNQYLGWSIASVGDVNDDGFRDIAIGAYGWGNGQTREGAIMVFHGSASGLNGGLPATPAHANFIGESDEVDAFLGWSVAGLGDVDGDGYDDVIAGGYGHDGPATSPSNFTGMALVWRGGPQGVNGGATGNPGNAYKVFFGPAGGSYFGTTVAGGGDPNDDGFADVLIGAKNAEGIPLIADEGFAYLYYMAPPVVIEFASSSTTVSVSESAGTVSLAVTVTPVQASQAITVQWSTTAGTATSPGDFVAASGTLTIAANQPQQSFTVTLTDDQLNELPEYFTVTISAPTGIGALLGASTTATVTITDDDPEPVLSLLSAAIGVPEDGGTVSLPAMLSAESGRDITFELSFTPGTAQPGIDYSGTNATVTIPKGDTTAVLSAFILDNTVVDGNRTFSLSIASPSGAALGAVTTATITIFDQDAAPVAAPSFTSASSATVSVGATLIHTVAASAGPAATLTSGALPAWLSFIGGTAPSGTGIQTTSATIAGVAPPGSEGTYTVTLTATNGIGLPVTQTFAITVTPSIHGPVDVNGDGSIDVVDVQLAVNLILAVSSPAYPLQGDANGDSAVDVVDVQSVVNRILSGQ